MTRRALTLIEVLAALALMGGTASAMVVAYTRALHQIHETRLRRQAFKRAHEQIVQWTLDNEPLDHNAEGRFENTTNQDSADTTHSGPWFWTRTVRLVRVTTTTDMHEITLAIRLEREGQPRTRLAQVVWFIPVGATEEEES